MTDDERDDERLWQTIRERLPRVGSSLPPEVAHLLRAVADAPPDELSCEECQAWIPTYVDAEMGGLPVGTEYPEVKRHLDLCPLCMAEYLELLELSMEAEAGMLPTPLEFGQPNLSFLPPVAPPSPRHEREIEAPSLSRPEYVRSLAGKILAAVAPARTVELADIATLFFGYVDARGGRFALDGGFALTLGHLGGTSGGLSALEVLAASYLATDALTKTLSPEALEAQRASGQLRETASTHASRAAQVLQLDEEQARTFAERYAELMTEDVAALHDLLSGRGD
jgi:hypothetical protein